MVIAWIICYLVSGWVRIRYWLDVHEISRCSFFIVFSCVDHHSVSLCWKACGAGDWQFCLYEHTTALPNPKNDAKGDGAFISLAKLRIAALKQPQPLEFDSSQLATKLQRALKAANCYTGKIDGIWGSGSRAALERFTKRAKTRKNFPEITDEALSFIRVKPDIKCNLKVDKKPKARKRLVRGCQLNNQIRCCLKDMRSACRATNNPYWCKRL